MTPVGIVIGTILIETSGHDNPPIHIANGILQALSTGVFIYVTFFEILQSELASGGNEFMKLLSMFIGVVALASLAIIPEDAGAGPHVLANATTGNN
jgi:zinc transporter 1/2/3